jgi:hypothetical protein
MFTILPTAGNASRARPLRDEGHIIIIGYCFTTPLPVSGANFGSGYADDLTDQFISILLCAFVRHCHCRFWWWWWLLGLPVGPIAVQVVS